MCAPTADRQYWSRDRATVPVYTMRGQRAYHDVAEQGSAAFCVYENDLCGS